MSDPIDPGSIRASDAERDVVAARLQDALEEGRLDLPEYQRRLDQTMKAKTRGELAPITADLPSTAPARRPRVPARPARSRGEEIWHLSRSWVATAIVLTTIWLLSGISSGFDFSNYWPIWPLGIWGAFLLARIIRGDR